VEVRSVRASGLNIGRWRQYGGSSPFSRSCDGGTKPIIGRFSFGVRMPLAGSQ